jgi:hypothetical protein
MKRYIYKNILGAKFFVGYLNGNSWTRKFFWNLNKAIAFADNQNEIGKTIVWSIDYRKVYSANNNIDFSVHPDANNFSTNI